MGLSVTIRGRLAAQDRAEREELKLALARVAQSIGDGVSTSGDIRDRAGKIVGEWSYNG